MTAADRPSGQRANVDEPVKCPIQNGSVKTPRSKLRAVKASLSERAANRYHLCGEPSGSILRNTAIAGAAGSMLSVNHCDAG